MHRDHLMKRAWGLLLCALLGAMAALPAQAQKTEIQYLSGQGRDNTVAWEFFCTKGRRAGEWTTIPVPSNWELQGFGEYNYGHDKEKSDEQGRYRYRFQAPAAWKGKRVRLVFEGVMTDVEVSINGKSAGPIHQGGFYRFKYDVTDLLRLGAENLLEATVSKVSANWSLEDAERIADYWVFGGIYRPVYLEALPAQYIDRVAVDPAADGRLRVDVYPERLSGASRVRAQVATLEGKPVGKAFSSDAPAGAAKVTLETRIPDVKTWSAESPNLYLLQLSLIQGDRPVHEISERIGFRTFENRPGEGLFLNGRRIRMKGVDRHSCWPDSGRCLCLEDSRRDAALIKEMNMNAVRMSHYPPDKHFLETCDEVGLYVIDELCTWQKPVIETELARKLVKELIVRDVNHPCILYWANGNEGGWNTEVDGDYALYDPQNRAVLHPWEAFGGVDTDHYESYESTLKKLQAAIPYLTTEFLHGLYDGGMGAGLDDYWNAMKASPMGAGGFLWVFADEGVVRTDKNGLIDVAGNYAPDGVVGPYREKEGSFYAVKQIWSPVQVAMNALPADFNGAIEVRNEYNFRNLNTCRFEWTLLNFPKPSDKAAKAEPEKHSVKGPEAEPGATAQLKLDLPEGWRKRDALQLGAFDAEGRELWTWCWPITTSERVRASLFPPAGSGKVTAKREEGRLLVTAGDTVFTFDASSAMLLGVRRGGKTWSLANGPRLLQAAGGAGGASGAGGTGGAGGAGAAPTAGSAPTIESGASEEGYRISRRGGADFSEITWLVRDGALRLDCAYEIKGTFPYLGFAFDYPEQQVRSCAWLGDGPFRVWKNRMKGTRLNVWRKAYNDAEPGVRWEYPEFKGFYANTWWARLETGEGNILIATDTPELFLGLYRPKFGPDPKKAVAEIPDADLSFLHAIPAIGTKFSAAGDSGPQGQPTQADGTYRATLFFRFE